VFKDGNARRAVRQGYRERPVRNAFVNLDDPGQYGRMLPMVILVLSKDGDSDTVGRLVKLLRNDPALCVVQTGPAPAGLDLHLIVRPDGSLSGAERLGRGFHPALVR
jgi:hypothetical protein